MKKILLGTTALIGAATLAAGAAFAGEDPKVTVGGFSTFEAGYTKDDNDAHDQSVLFRNDTEIHFNVAGKTDFGLGYGAEIDLNADVDGGTSVGTPGYNNTGLNAHRTYGWLQGDQWGHVEFGSNDGAASTLKVDASNIARATGGIDGDWEYFAHTNAPGAASSAAGALVNAHGVANFITSPNLPIENGLASSYYTYLNTNNTKITYYTPRFAGFQLGVSYAPNLNQGQDTTSLYDSLDFTNIWSGGVNYQGSYEQIGIAAAATGEYAHYSYDPTLGDLNDIKAWNAGAKLSYLGWSVAGSYGDWERSESIDGTHAEYWTGGLAYETGPIGASVTYLGSQDRSLGNDKFQDISVGVDYKLAPGLTPFIEYTWYDVDPTGAGTSGLENKGNVVLVGSQLSF